MNTEFYLARIERLLEEYLSDCDRLARERKPNELFGLKFGPSDNPRHERFAEDMAAFFGDFAAQDPDSGAVRALLGKLYRAPEDYPGTRSAYWMLIAVQAHTRELIPLLEKQDAAALLKDYERLWPRHMRLPVQDELLKLLKKASAS